MANRSKLSFRGGGSTDHTKPEDLSISFHEAASQGDRKKLKKIIQQGINIDYPNSTGQTALFLAAFEGHESIVELLLRHGANPNQRSNEGVTPVHVAGYSGNPRIVSLLIEAGGDLRFHDWQGRSTADWIQSQADVKKRRSVMEFIEKKRMSALTKSGVELLETNVQLNRDIRSISLSTILRQRTVGKSVTCSTSVHSDGFGRICIGDGDLVGVVGSIPLVTETSLKHDEHGYTFDNGPFMVVESMLWNKEPVSVKRLHKNPPAGGHVDMLITELSYMTRLHHPNVLLLMGACRTNNLDSLVLIYERVPIGSLFCFLYQKMETLSLYQSVLVLMQTASALLYLHRGKLLHCSVSPHAIYLIRPDFAKLGNFDNMVENISVDGNGPVSHVIENKYMNAVYNWLSPELLTGQAATEKSDLYSFCVVIWELINRKMPWYNVPAASIQQRVIDHGQALPLGDGIEDPFNVILQYGLSTNPDERRLSLEQTRDYLAEYISDHSQLDGGVLHSSRSHQSDERREAKRIHFSPAVDATLDESSSGRESETPSTDDVVTNLAEEEATSLNNLALELVSNVSSQKDAVDDSRGQKNSTSSHKRNDQISKDQIYSHVVKELTPIVPEAKQRLKPAIKQESNRTLHPVEEDTIVKTILPSKQQAASYILLNKTYNTLEQMDKQCESDDQRSPENSKSDFSKVAKKDSTEYRLPDEQKNADIKRSEEKSESKEALDDAQSKSGQLFDFIQNPKKKAFFEDNYSELISPRNGVISPRNGVSPRVLWHQEDKVFTGMTESSGKMNEEKSSVEISYKSENRNLVKETEEFLKSSTILKPISSDLPHKFVTLGYNNILYKPKDSPVTQPEHQDGGVEEQQSCSAYSSNVSARAVLQKRCSNNPTFGISLKELQSAISQKTDQDVVQTSQPDTNARVPASSISPLSNASHSSRAVDSVTPRSNDILNSLRLPVTSLSSTSDLQRDDSSYRWVNSARSNSSSKPEMITSHGSSQYLKNGHVHESRFGMTRKNIGSLLVSKQDARPNAIFKSQNRSVFVQKEVPRRLSALEVPSNSLLTGEKSRVTGKSFCSGCSTEFKKITGCVRSVKPASHHEPCLLKPSKFLVSTPNDCQAPCSTSFYATSTVDSPRAQIHFSAAKFDSPCEKKIASAAAKLNYSRSNENTELKSGLNKIVQNKSTQERSDSGDTAESEAEPANELSIKELVSSYQNKVEEHKRRQSILTLKKKKEPGEGELETMNSSWTRPVCPKIDLSFDGCDGNTIQSARYSDGRRETLIGKKGSTSLSNTPRSFESDRRRQVDKNLEATPVGSGFNTPRDSNLATPRGSETPRVSNLATPRGAGLGTPRGSNFERRQGSDTPRGSNVANETITPRASNDLATPRGSATITRRQNSSRENRSVCVSKFNLSLVNQSSRVSGGVVNGDEPVENSQKVIKTSSELSTCSAEANQLVNSAITNCQTQIMDEYSTTRLVHRQANHDVVKGGKDSTNRDEGNDYVEFLNKLVPSGSGGPGGEVYDSNSASRYRSIAVNTNGEDHHGRQLHRKRLSPAGSDGSYMSSDIKDFYCDDEISPELAMQKHMRLQGTPAYNSNDGFSKSSYHQVYQQYNPASSYGWSGSESGEGGSPRKRSPDLNDSVKSSHSAVLAEQATDSDSKGILRGASVVSAESGQDTDTDSTVSSLTEALCVTKRINTSKNDGCSSSVTVESHAKGYHTITCDKTDPVTGNKSTTYRAKVKAPRVITKFILDDDDEKPYQL